MYPRLNADCGPGPDGRTASSGRSFGRQLAAILVIAAAARAAILVYAEFAPQRFDYPDSRRYVRVAEHIAAGLGPIDVVDGRVVRAGTDPGYPALLAAGMRLGIVGTDAAMRFGRLANGVFGLASAALLAWLTRRLFGDGAALWAAAFLAVDPITVFFHGLALTETCYVTLMLAALCAARRASGRSGWLFAALAGMLVGAGTLTRSSGLFMPFVLAPFVWRFTGGRRAARLGSVLVFIAASALTLGPTTARNYGLFGRIVPVRTGAGASMLEALGPWADGGPGMDRVVYPVGSDADELRRDELCRRAAIDWAVENPRRVLELAWIKFRRTWSITIHAPGYSSAAYTAIGWVTVAPIYAAALIGLWRLRRRPTTAALLLLVPAYFTVVHMVFVGSVRYRMPAMPFVFMAAAVGMQHVVQRVREHRRSAATTG